MRAWVLGICLLTMAVAAQAAPPAFPALTGRVVDQANVLTPSQEAELTGKLEAFEQQTHHQLVVATVKSLEGREIEPYAVDLARHWKLGGAKEDDGALLLLAPTERRTRIEVGYGLEGTLTDALASAIIQQAMLPALRQGQYAHALFAGTGAIISVLGGNAAAFVPHIPPPTHTQEDSWKGFYLFLFLFVICWALARNRRTPWWADVLYIGSSGFSGSGRSGGGGFSGGGGSFGGGGASGGW